MQDNGDRKDFCPERVNPTGIGSWDRQCTI